MSWHRLGRLRVQEFEKVAIPRVAWQPLEPEQDQRFRSQATTLSEDRLQVVNPGQCLRQRQHQLVLTFRAPPSIRDRTEPV